MSHNPAFPFSSESHYLGLRGRLIGFFAAQECRWPVDLADETLLRVLVTHERRAADCSFDQWTFGVARNVLHEWRRVSLRTVQLDAASQNRMASRYLPELDIDLLPLDASDRAFVREYFIEKPGARVLANESGLSEAGVRSRAHRIRRRLRAQFHCGPSRPNAMNSRVSPPAKH